MTTQSAIQACPLFSLGQTLATPGALSALESIKLSAPTLLQRHQSGDWGNLSAEDWQQNEQALDDQGRLFSVYRINDKTRFWVITEADRSATTVLLPEEY